MTMNKRNRTAAAYLLIGVAAAGRAFLGMPDATALQEVSLTVLALVGCLLLAGQNWKPLALGVPQLVLELLLCGAGTDGVWTMLAPALRAVDLWLFWAMTLVLLRQIGQAHCKMPLVAAVPLAVYTVAHFLPAAAKVASFAFIAFSIVLLWFAVLMLRAYSEARK